MKELKIEKDDFSFSLFCTSFGSPSSSFSCVSSSMEPGGEKHRHIVNPGFKRGDRQVVFRGGNRPADSVSDDSFTVSSSAVMFFSSAFAGAELEASSSVSSSSLECAAQPGQKALSGPEDNLQPRRVTW